MQITTPSGYLVTLKDKLTFGEVRQLQKSLFSGVKIGLTEGKMPELDLNNLFEYNEKALPFVVTEIVVGDQKITTDIEKTISNWDYVDGQAVFDAMEKVLKPVMGSNTEEKKSKV